MEANGEIRDLSPEDIEKYNCPVTNVQIEKNDRSILEDVDVISQNHSLEEELEFERQVGRIIDDKLAIKNTYEMAATSLIADTSIEVLDKILEIYNICKQQEMFLLDIYFDGATEAIDGDYKVQARHKLNSIKCGQFENLKDTSQLLSRDNYNKDHAICYAEIYYDNYNTSYPYLSDMGEIVLTLYLKHCILGGFYENKDSSNTIYISYICGDSNRGCILEIKHLCIS